MSGTAKADKHQQDLKVRLQLHPLLLWSLGRKPSFYVAELLIGVQLNPHKGHLAGIHQFTCAKLATYPGGVLYSIRYSKRGQTPATSHSEVTVASSISVIARTETIDLRPLKSEHFLVMCCTLY